MVLAFLKPNWVTQCLEYNRNSKMVIFKLIEENITVPICSGVEVQWYVYFNENNLVILRNKC